VTLGKEKNTCMDQDFSGKDSYERTDKKAGDSPSS